METKICTKCGIEKEINKFKRFKSTNGKYYYTGDCKQCRNLVALEYNREYRNTHKKEIKITKQKHYIRNKEKVAAKHKEYYEKHKEELKAKTRKWYLENKDIVAKTRKQKYDENKDTILKDRYEYKKKRLKVDNLFKIKEQTRNMIRTAFRKKGISKSKKTKEILGCELDYFYQYLLQTFLNNYGYEYDFKEPIDIDHIKPLKSATTEEEIIKLCHYTNLQLLKKEDNKEKSAKINWKLKKEE